MDRRATTLLELDHAIRARPELDHEEHESARLVADVMERGGFETRRAAYGLETAIEAIHGHGDRTVALCAEYDALPGIGHACGHDMIAAMGVGAALALREVADAAGLRVKLLGTPAEEHGGGKVDLLRAGAWEDVAFSMMAHGNSSVDKVCRASTNTAAERFEVTFTGRAPRAAHAPSRGIDAASAANIAVTAIGHLRQHFTAGSSVNAFVSHGGEATDIIPGSVVVQVEVRAADAATWRDLGEKVRNCFAAGALATGCEWSHRRTENPYAPLDDGLRLAGVWNGNLRALGRELGTEADTAGGATLDGAKALALTALDVALDTTLRAELLEQQHARPAGATRVEF